MKKVLVLTLVMGIASLATAGLSLSGVDNGNGTYTYSFIQDAENTTGSGGALTFDIGSGVYSSSFVQDATGYDAGSGANVTGWDWSLNAWGELSGDWKLSLVPNLGAGTPGTGSVLGAYITGPNAGDDILFDGVLATLTVDVASVDVTGSFDGVSFDETVVPEPATMALLGLGALVLRRKK